MQKAIHRLYAYISQKGIKPASFEKKAGLSNGYLSKQYKRNADIGESIFIQVLEYCPDISIDWLLTGEGKMLKTESCSSDVNALEQTDALGTELQKKYIEILEERRITDQEIKELHKKLLEAKDEIIELYKRLEDVKDQGGGIVVNA